MDNSIHARLHHASRGAIGKRTEDLRPLRSRPELPIKIHFERDANVEDMSDKLSNDSAQSSSKPDKSRLGYIPDAIGKRTQGLRPFNLPIKIRYIQSPTEVEEDDTTRSIPPFNEPARSSTEHGQSRPVYMSGALGRPDRGHLPFRLSPRQQLRARGLSTETGVDDDTDETVQAPNEQEADQSLPVYRPDTLGRRTLGFSPSRTRPTLGTEARDLRFETDEDGKVSQFQTEQGQPRAVSRHNGSPPHTCLEGSSWASSTRSSSLVTSSVGSGISTTVNSARSSAMVHHSRTSSTSESVRSSSSPPELQFTDEEARLQWQIAKAEQALYGLRTELLFYYQRSISRDDLTPKTKEIYEDKRERHSKEIAKYMTGATLRSSGDKDSELPIGCGPQGQEAVIASKEEDVAHDSIKEVRVAGVMVELEVKEVPGLVQKVKQVGNVVVQTENGHPEELKNQVAVYITNDPSTFPISAPPAPPSPICLPPPPLPLHRPSPRRRRTYTPAPPSLEQDLPPLPSIQSDMQLVQMQPPIVPPRPLNYRGKNRNFTLPVKLDHGLDAALAADTETTTMAPPSRRSASGPLPQTASQPATSAPVAPVRVNDSRRMVPVPTRLNTFATLLETFNRGRASAAVAQKN